MARKVLISMADYGHDPTETSVPYTTFKKAGFQTDFATQAGKVPQCDQKLLVGTTQKLLGANKSTIALYNDMSKSPEFMSPKSWSDPNFKLDSYDLLFFPGGHEKGVRQLYDDPIMQKLVAEFFPQTEKPSGKVVAAVCHGVLSLSEAKISQGEHQGKSVIHACDTTTLPTRFEQAAFWGTRLWLGDYYKTYGARSENVEDMVRSRLDNPQTQFKGSLGFKPFVVSDHKYNYLSARWPGDAQLLADKTVELMQSYENDDSTPKP